VLARSDWIKAHPKTVERLLRAISQTEKFMAEHPAEAQRITGKRLGLSDAEVAAIWGRNTFALSLDMALVLAMEDQARWMIQHDLTPEKQVPDVVSYMYTGGLQAVDPAAVTVIR
jgi:NitT/TauT family transport system substrate-binding protein